MKKSASFNLKLFLIAFLGLQIFLGIEISYSQEDQDFRRMDYNINSKYRGGEFLIYDCRNSYYACVDSSSYESCQLSREASISKKENIYPCAPLKKFVNKKECLLKNYDVIESLAKKRFCYPKN